MSTSKMKPLNEIPKSLGLSLSSTLHLPQHSCCKNISFVPATNNRVAKWWSGSWMVMEPSSLPTATIDLKEELDTTDVHAIETIADGDQCENRQRCTRSSVQVRLRSSFSLMFSVVLLSASPFALALVIASGLMGSVTSNCLAFLAALLFLASLISLDRLSLELNYVVSRATVQLPLIYRSRLCVCFS